MKTWVKTIFSLFVSVVLLGASACAPVQSRLGLVASEDIADIIAKYREEIPQRMQQENVSGLAVVVVDDQNILWTEGFGYTDWGQKTPVTPSTLFSIQSMSKSFTATAVMFAAQDGLVDLDAPITTYLPDFHVNSIYEEHPEEKITLRLLLSHTAGLVHEAPIGGNYDLPGHSFEEHIASISDTWLSFPVGTRWGYSNLGIDLAGYILQVRSGMPFTQYVQEKVLDPLGMMNSTLDINQVLARPDRAIGHGPLPFRPPTKFLLIPSGGVWTTVSDMARYLQFHINEGALDGTRLLRQDLAETMYQPPNPAALNAEYALGIGTANWQGTRRFQHGGGGFGFNSNMVWHPELKLGAVVLSNVDDASLNMQLIDDLLGSIISANIPLYHSRASSLPSVQPAYGFIQDGSSLLTDTALRDLIAGKALVADEAARQRHQSYKGTYVKTKWGFPYYVIEAQEINERFVAVAMDLKIELTEVEPGLFVDQQGSTYDFETLDIGPNLALVRVPAQRLPSRLTIYTVCGLLFLSALFLWPGRPIAWRVRRKGKTETTSLTDSSSNYWLVWIEILAALASLVSLMCLAAIILVPNLIYIPWPRPYADLSWWQFAFLSLPYISPTFAVLIALMTSLHLRSQKEGRAICLYYLVVALALLSFNLAILL